jgi:murein DD-endopeptidase MepM/ murein hydrolase activator NlpD
MLIVPGIVKAVPASLDHRIRFRVEGDLQDTEIRYQGTPVRKNVLRIRPPLRGDSWKATEGPSANNHHTAGALQVDGRIRVPQRFAIDFLRVYEDGAMYRGDPTDVHNYRCYGAEALAGSDALVVAVRDGIPENAGQSRTNVLPDRLDNLGGNRVILDLGGGLFAAYGHLQPGSIRVKEGNRVKPGDVLGLVGNSGAPVPHLHFQIMDGPGLLTSEGMPYVLDSFLHDGKRVADQLPLDGWKLAFDDGPQVK